MRGERTCTAASGRLRSPRASGADPWRARTCPPRAAGQYPVVSPCAAARPPLCACWTSLCSWPRVTPWCRMGPPATWARCAGAGAANALGLMELALGPQAGKRARPAGAPPAAQPASRSQLARPCQLLVWPAGIAARPRASPHCHHIGGMRPLHRPAAGHTAGQGARHQHCEHHPGPA